MIHSKNNYGKAGFSLMEIMVVLTIVSLVLTPLFVLQSTTVRSVLDITQRFENMARARTFLYEQYFKVDTAKPAMKATKTIKPGGVMLTYQCAKPVKKSAFYDYADVFIESVIAGWSMRGEAMTESLGTLSFFPSTLKKEKKG